MTGQRGPFDPNDPNPIFRRDWRDSTPEEIRDDILSLGHLLLGHLLLRPLEEFKELEMPNDPVADRQLEAMYDKFATFKRLLDDATRTGNATLQAVYGYSCDRLGYEISARITGAPGSSRL